MKIGILTFSLVKNKKRIFLKLKLDIWEELMVMRFHQKNNLRTIINVQKLHAIGVLFALLWRVIARKTSIILGHT